MARRKRGKKKEGEKKEQFAPSLNERKRKDDATSISSREAAERKLHYSIICTKSVAP
jgi:hypothetical protein